MEKKAKATMRIKGGEISVEVFPFRTAKGNVDLFSRFALWSNMAEGGKREVCCSFGGSNYNETEIKAMAVAMLGIMDSIPILNKLNEGRSDVEVLPEVARCFDLLTDEDRRGYENEVAQDQEERRARNAARDLARKEQEERDRAEDAVKIAEAMSVATETIKSFGFKISDFRDTYFENKKAGLNVEIVKKFSGGSWSGYPRRFRTVSLVTRREGQSYRVRSKRYGIAGFVKAMTKVHGLAAKP
jgi:hypothetical protein